MGRLALLLWLAALPAAAAPLDVDSQPVHSGQVWMRTSQTSRAAGAWSLQGTSTPLRLEVSDQERYDLCFAGESHNLLWRWSGQALAVPAGQVTLRVEPQLAWDRVLGALGLVVAGLILSLARLRRRTRRLEEKLRTARLRVQRLEGDPERIGAYQVLGRLGEGGMGRVYQVRDRLGDIYALKVPNASLGRFEREWKILRRFEHPDIVRVHDYQSGPPPYLVMELVRGTTLAARLRQSALSVGEARRIARRLLHVLLYTHERGIVHRDLSPNNIFLLDDGAVKVVDFGISKDFSNPVTHTGEMSGTPAYAAPEQIESQAATERTDLYTVGVLLYQMLTGRVPFETGDALKLFHQKAEGVKVSPHELNPAVEPTLSAAVMALLQSDPSRRPASARAALELI